MGVEVRLSGSLVARAGARRAHVPVREQATVVDIVQELADQYGPQVRPAILNGERLRSDTRAVRELPAPGERLGSNSTIKSGDTVRFELAE
jgi:hypothetical protein